MCLGVPAEVVAIPDPQVPRATVAISGVERVVATDLLMDDDLGVGDWVLVHVGFALSKIDADEAAMTLTRSNAWATTPSKTNWPPSPAPRSNSRVMKYVDEYRDPVAAKALLATIKAQAARLERPIAVMEICGGHTHTIYRHGLGICCPRRSS